MSDRLFSEPTEPPIDFSHDHLPASPLSFAYTTDLGRLAAMNVVLLGIPGAGKTTLADELQILDENITYISLGEISRNLDPDSSQRKELDRLFSLGKPVGIPELFLDIVEPHIDRAISNGGGFLLDGIPKKAEEIDPLLHFLGEKNALPDLIVSCELPPVVAYARTTARLARAGDPDTTEIFLNRTKTYLRDMDTFKDALSNNGERPVIILDTDRHSPVAAARATLMLAGLRREQVSENESREAVQITRLHEYLQNDNREEAFRIIGQEFDGTLKNIDYGMVFRSDMTYEDRTAYIEAAFLLQDPRLQDTPYFLKRLTENYISNTLGSIEHLYDSLKQEVGLRYGESFTEDNVRDVYSQQLGLRDTIQELQERIVTGESLETLTNSEIALNLAELFHIEKVLVNRAVEYGLDPSDGDIETLMRLQPKLWAQLTSNQILFAPDNNYRSRSNGIQGSHHSLLPFTRNIRAMAANSMGQYIPFIEAVSATENKFSSTFGFIHFVGMDENGEAFGVEYPIMMHDRRLLDLKSQTINDVLKMTDEFYGNHDLWHNLLPVFSKNFILHHPDAPLSYGGRLKSYTDFGRDLREEKEEYEIGMAMMHARTQQERFAENPALRKRQETLILDSLDTLLNLPMELQGKCTPEEIDDIVDYLACKAATKAYNVFPDNDPIYTIIKEKLTALAVKPQPVSSSEVAELLLMQGLLNEEELSNILPNDHYPTLQEKRTAIHSDDTLASAVIRTSIDPTNEKRESGAEYLVETMQAWGILETLGTNPKAHLDVIQKSRWLAMTAPQRQQLKGHMEKVHGKAGYQFDDQTFTEPRDLILIQQNALRVDESEYQYRIAARQTNQQLSYGIYSLLFDDKQALHKESRAALDSLRTSKDTGQQLFAREATSMLDKIMHELVSNTYAPLDDELEYLESFSNASADRGDNEQSVTLASTIRSILNQYRALAQQEHDHQHDKGITYVDASKRLTDEQMTIS